MRTQISSSPLSDRKVKRTQSLFSPGQAKTAEIGNLHGPLIAWALLPIVGCTGHGDDHPQPSLNLSSLLDYVIGDAEIKGMSVLNESKTVWLCPLQCFKTWLELLEGI